MAAGRLIWSLRLFVLFILVCKVRCSTGTRNCNITATCRLRKTFFSRVIHYPPNWDAGYNPCEIPLDCIHPNPGPVKNPCVHCKRAIVDSNSNFTLNVKNMAAPSKILSTVRGLGRFNSPPFCCFLFTFLIPFFCKFYTRYHFRCMFET